MRILLICAAFPPFGKGGGPASSELLAHGLVNRGHAVRVLTVAGQDATDVRNGIEVKTIKSLNVYWDYWKPNPLAAKVAWHVLENFNPYALIRMRLEMREFSPDIVATIGIENVNVATWLAARLEGIPVSHMIYSYFLMCWRGLLFHRGHNCKRRCVGCITLSTGKKVMSRFVDSVAAESNAALTRHLQAGYFTGALTGVVPGAIEKLPTITPHSSEGKSLRVGFIGLHSPNKGIETLARAASLIPASTPIEFLIAGDGDGQYTQELQRAFPAAATRFVGWVNPDQFFRKIDVNVVPSLSEECFGRVSIESQSYGIPTLVSRSGGLSSNIVEGETGFSFEPGDYIALASQIQRLATERDLLRRMGVAARDNAARFCLPHIAKRFEQFLDETLVYVQRKRSQSSDNPAA